MCVFERSHAFAVWLERRLSHTRSLFIVKRVYRCLDYIFSERQKKMQRFTFRFVVYIACTCCELSLLRHRSSFIYVFLRRISLHVGAPLRNQLHGVGKDRVISYVTAILL